MSSASAVSYAKLTDRPRHSHLSETIRNKKTEDIDAFFEVEHKHNNPFASLDHVHVNRSIIYVATQQVKHIEHPRKYQRFLAATKQKVLRFAPQ